MAGFSSPSGPPSEAPTGQCLNLSPDLTEGMAACVILAGRHEGGPCPPCDPAADRSAVASVHAGAVDLARSSQTAVENELDCFCEIPQLTGAAGMACQNDPSDPVLVDGVEQDGVCYVDATTTPPVGNPELTKNCSPTSKRLLRLLGKARPVFTASTGPEAVFMVCEAEKCQTP